MNMRSLLLVFCFLFTCPTHAACLQNGDTITLSGVLVTKTYQSPDDTPTPVIRWILQLDKPMDCVVNIDKGFQLWNRDVTIFPPYSSKNTGLLENKHITATGRLTLAATAYNFTAVLLLAEKVETTTEPLKIN
jgi:hypothetical protein